MDLFRNPVEGDLIVETDRFGGTSSAENPNCKGWRSFMVAPSFNSC